VGRLVQQKGHRYLIEAVGEVIQQYGPVNLLLVGDGVLRSELTEMCAELGIASHVHFVGFQDDVLPYLQATDIAVMPSLFEVFSLAMLEYMALGKPVIASDHASFKEAITDGIDGLIVPMKDSHSLAEAIIKLLKDENLRIKIGKLGRKRVLENFGIDRLVNEMMDLYDHILL
jgi:glycosyltransferase involved in cell wall biosynthesis